MKKRLFAAAILACLLLTSCFERDLPLNETVQDTTIAEDTAAIEDTTAAEPTPALPVAEFPFSNDYITVKEASDGKYHCITKSPNHVRARDKAHILQYIDDYGNVVKNFLLYNEENGLINNVDVFSENGIPQNTNWASENFLVIGNYVICGYSVYNAKFQYIGYYRYEKLSDINAQYFPETDSLKVGENTYYPRLKHIDTVPDGSILLDSKTVWDEESAIYKHDSKYYFKNEGITVILPISGEYDSVSLIHPEMVEFVSINGGELHKITVEWVYSGKTPGDWYPGFVVNEKSSEYMIEDYTHFDYNEYIIVKSDPYSYAVKDGKLVYTFNKSANYGAFSTIDELLINGTNNSDYTDVTVHNPDLSLFVDEIFESFNKLPDGNYIGQLFSGPYRIYDSKANVVYSSPDNVNWLAVGTDIVLSLDKDNTLCFYTPYGELVYDFGKISENLGYNRYMSGYYKEKGYYFVFSDYTDSDENGRTHFYEYYYIPETGESGIIDYYDFEGALAKPVLYLYPTEETEVSVKFEHPERLIVDYPVYNDGWHVTASTDGTLKDARGRSYYALYWEESRERPGYDFTDGFCVKGEDSAEFLEEKLAKLGFNEREANEFIIYWLPIMEQSEYNLIRFELTDEREASNALYISPAPDSLLRIAMHIKPLENEVSVVEQKLPAFHRHGFSAIEWGGCVH